MTRKSSAAQFLTFRARSMLRPFSHLGTGTHAGSAFDRPFLHLNPPAFSLVPPILSRDSAPFLTYPAHSLTSGALTIGNDAQKQTLNLNLESLNKENAKYEPPRRGQVCAQSEGEATSRVVSASLTLSELWRGRKSGHKL